MRARPTSGLISRLGVACVATALTAQLAGQRVEFEVASVRLHTSDDQRIMMVAQPGGRFVAANIPLRLFIRTAYQLQDDQIVGGPAWLATDRFDIEARSGDTGPPGVRLLQMMQSLLEDRFKMTSHREKRELPVFALEREKSDGPLGPSLKPTACPDLTTDLANIQRCANMSTGLASLSMRGMPFDQFAAYLSPYVSRVVVDRTKLEGRYDIELKWTPERPAAAAGAGEPPAADPNAVSIFTAIQEQLGLRLSASRDAVDVLVIDTLEQLSPN